MAQHNSIQNFVKKIISSKIFIFAASFILIALAISVIRESYHKAKLAEEIEGLKSEVERLEGRNQQLSSLLGYFKEDTYLEKEARLKLNLKKPGEKVVILPQSQSSEYSILNETENNEAKESSSVNGKDNWWKWWEYFFED